MTIYPRRKLTDTGHILAAVKTEELAKPLAVTLAEERAETLDKTNSYMVKEAISDRLDNTSAM